MPLRAKLTLVLQTGDKVVDSATVEVTRENLQEIDDYIKSLIADGFKVDYERSEVEHVVSDVKSGIH